VSTNPFLSFAHLVSRGQLRAKGEPVRFIGLDVHLDFCEIAICEDGRVRSAGRVASSPEGLQILANSLGPQDQVALEATGNALAIARLLEPHVARVAVAARSESRAITEAKVKTDRHDARTLARLLAAGLLRRSGSFGGEVHRGGSMTVPLQQR
jgi:hypothetical protein